MQMSQKIIDIFLKISKHTKIYIYNYYPSNFNSLREFIDYTINDKTYTYETYKSWIYFMNYLIKSPIYTEDPSLANLFLVPQYENISYGKNYYEALILPLENAIKSKYYINTAPLRNHIFIYISDDTPLYDRRIPEHLRFEMERRFIRITYSGRISNFGTYHNTNQTDSIFNFDNSDEIVVPPLIPLSNYIKTEPTKYCKNNILYKGDLNPSSEQRERSSFLRYIKSNSEIHEDDSYFGIHSAGYGIWTARLYNYLNMGIIPIISSDGVILPFEKFINYRSFSVKLLSSTYNSNNSKPMEKIRDACNMARKYANNCEEIVKEEKELAERIYKMQANAKEVSDWFDWKSTIPYKNPFTLIILELFEHIVNNKLKINDPVAKEEFYDFNNNNLSVYN